MTISGPGPAKRPTIYDLAQIAGASPSAVSAVLNGSWRKRRISAATAERITRIAEDEGYAVNLQASMLRRDRSRVIGMIVPKYDNRYFGALAEQFEATARARGQFPVITCTLRDPDLEFEAAREMVSYQAEWLVVTGATEPDRIARHCAAAGVRTINLDLPGTLAPTILSDNFDGARRLTHLLLDRLTPMPGGPWPLWFVGGRAGDHNTAERLRGWRAAQAERGLPVTEQRIVTPGYAPAKVTAALDALDVAGPVGLFVNSTITLEGVVPWLTGRLAPDDWRLGCFDWDPFAALLPQNVGMAEQDVPGLIARLFAAIDAPPGDNRRIEVPCILRPLDRQAASAA